jgi:hypothetical protein
VFPLETRALAIAFFYAIGTAAGGITGPLLFGHLIEGGSKSDVAIAFYIGSAFMAIGGIAELFLGVRAEQQALEDVATPITAQDTEQGEEEGEAAQERDEEREARRRDAERDRRIRQRSASRADWERTGRRRLRPGPGGTLYAPRMAGTGPIAENPLALERQIEVIEQALEQQGPVDRRRLAQLVGARYWGPGRFRLALQEALREGRAQRLSGGVIAPVQR